MVFQRRAVDPEPDGEDNAGEKRVGEAVLSMPGSAATTGQPERDLVVEEEAEDLGADDSDPGRHCEEGHLEGGESVAAGFDGGFQEGGECGGLHDGEAEGNEDVGSCEEGDGGEGDLEGDDGTADLDKRCEICWLYG